jgi:histidinol-phosphate aminotransferase
VATLEHEDKVRDRLNELREWTARLSIQLQGLGVHTFPTETYFFLADFAPHDATELAGRMQERGIFIKPLNDPQLGTSFMRVTTALPEDNEYVVDVLRELLQVS